MALPNVIIEDTTDLVPYIDALNRGIQEAYARAAAFINFPPVTIFVSSAPSDSLDDVGGICGYTPRAEEMFLYLDVGCQRFEKSLREDGLTRTLIHELHHAARWCAPGYGETLFDALVTEGLADHFVYQVTGQPPDPWSTALSDAEFAYWMNVAERCFDDVSYAHDEWFFGCPEKQMPKWIGYTLGYAIVGRYLSQHPHESPASLVHAPSGRFRSKELRLHV